MAETLQEWLNLLLRATHVVAAISWIGNSFYFMWLDRSLDKPKSKDDSLIGSLWMVHSGGFYSVEKRHLKPKEIPPVLHWFKWEAGFTWLSGFSLLVLVYYMGSNLTNIGQETLPHWQLVTIGLLVLMFGWAIYDLLWMSKLGEKPVAGAIVSFLLLSLLTFGLSKLYGGRALYYQIGALLGTLMVANVWMRILPAQREMIQSAREGKERNAQFAARAKGRSVHNNAMTFPVVFIMISNHYPSTYGHELNWLLLLIICLAGYGIRYSMNEKSTKGKAALAFSIIAITFVAWLTSN
jgi:uncharacterized membrane protein